jgi:hypothetical protein
MPDLPSNILPELAKETSRNIREALFELHRLAEGAGFGMVADFFRMGIIEANHFAGDDNLIEMRNTK